MAAGGAARTPDPSTASLGRAGRRAVARSATVVAWLSTPSPPRDRLLTTLSAVGWGIGATSLLLLLTLPDAHGGLGYDAHSYWVAGRNVLEGQPLYWPVAIDEFGPYRYPPLFAQLWAPFALLPELAFTWLWRGFCFATLYYLAGSWRNVGLWMLLPLTISELSAANVTFPVAAGTLAAFRGSARWLLWVAALKFGPMLAVPYVWIRRAGHRRELALSLLTLAGACALSFVIDPASWVLYLEALTWQSSSELIGGGLLSILPTAAADFLLRASIGAVLVVVAIQRTWPRLAYASTVIAVPTLWVNRLSALLATPRAVETDHAPE